MDLTTWLISSASGITAGLAIVGLINWHATVQAHRRRKPNCHMLHSIATSELIVYGKIVSPDVKEHVATCPTWAKVAAKPVGTHQVPVYVEYVCEHEWTLAGECFKCGTNKAEAYRLPTIREVGGEHKKNFRRPA
jgi:hypothetical protein